MFFLINTSCCSLKVEESTLLIYAATVLHRVIADTRVPETTSLAFVASTFFVGTKVSESSTPGWVITLTFLAVYQEIAFATMGALSSLVSLTDVVFTYLGPVL